jgi:hypothetical protein
MADAQATKRRMGTLKQLGIGAAAALACLVLAVIVLSQLAARWEARVQPLTVEEVRQLMAKSSGPRSDDSQKRAALAGDLPGEEAGTTDPITAGTEAETPLLDSRTAKALRLASRPTPDRLARKFETPTGSAVKVASAKVSAFVSRAVWFTVYQLRGNMIIGYRSTLNRAADASLDAGAYASARSWYREGIRVAGNDVSRRYYSEQLAWLEEDPEVAAALLEESFSRPIEDKSRGPYDPWIAAMNALDLSIATGSDDLAEGYYLRFRDSWPRWTEMHRAFAKFGPEREAWIRNYEAKAASK